MYQEVRQLQSKKDVRTFIEDTMKIKVDCKFLAGKFAEDVCLAHSKGKEVEKCKGECEDCKKKEE